MIRTPIKASPSAVTVERTLRSTGATLRLVLEPLPARHVLIVEYRRRRKSGDRFERMRDEEGVRVPFEQLKLDRTFEQLFPQGRLFE
ncbi:MAG: hypothetical protein WDA03_05945 [Trueperaceae bacterium]|jgi:hypothetical protein